MLRAFIFDIGNVLLRFDFAIAIKRLASRMDPISDTVLHEIEPLKVAYESGQIARAEFLPRLGAIIRYTGTEPEFVDAWEDIFTENEPMTALVERLHAERRPLYLLSNTSDLHLDHVFRRYGVFRFFADGVYSFRAGCMKPDARIFEIAQKQFGVEPAETLFIDDLAPNVEAARAAGFQAWQYYFARHEEFMAFLRQNGALPDAP